MSLVYKLDVEGDGITKMKKFSSEAGNAEKATRRLDAQTNELSRDLAKIKADQLSGIRSGFAGMISPANLATGAFIAAGAALAMLASEMLTSYDSAAKLGRNTSIAAEQVLGLRYAAELSGVGAEAMDSALQKLTMNIGKAAQGTGEAAPAFKQMGIELNNSNGTLKNADQIMSEVADKFQGMGDSTDRARLATQLFGESGVKMIDMLKGGSAGLSAMTSEGAAAAGNVKEISAMVEDFNDSVTRGKTAAMGMLAVIADTGPIKAAVGAMKELSNEYMQMFRDYKGAEQAENALAQNTLRSWLQRKNYMKAVVDAGYEIDENEKKELEHITKYFDVMKKKAGLDEKAFALLAAETQISAANRVQKELGAEVDVRAARATIDAHKASEKAALDAQLAAQNAAKTLKDQEAAALAAANAEKKRLEDRKRLEDSVAKEYEAMHSKRRASAAESAMEAELASQRQARGVQQISEQEYNQLTELATLRKQMSMDGMFELERELALRNQKFEQEKANLQILHEIELANSNDKATTKSQQQTELANLERQNFDDQAKLRDADKKRGDEKLKDSLDKIAAERDAQLDAVAANAAAFQTLTKESKKYRVAYKAGAATEAGINATQAVLKTMSATPYPFNIPLAIMQGAAGAVQVNKIVSAKMHTGGMISGKNTLIMTNEDGDEGILSTTGVRAVGGPAGVAALNGGQANYNTTNHNTNQSTVIVNVGLISQKALNDQVLPAMRDSNYRY